MIVNKTNKQRLWQFDMLKLIAIYSVILGHVILHSGYNWHDAFGLPINTFIYTFHLPLFMTISGFFSSFSDKDKLKKRILQLIIPVISFSFINIFLNHIYNIKIDLWFIPSLIICNLIVYFFLIFGKSNSIRFIIVFVISSLIILSASIRYLQEYQLLWMLPFFILGILLKKNINKIKGKKLLVFIISCLLYLFLVIFIYDYTYTFDISGMKIITRDGIQTEIVIISLIRYLSSFSIVMTFFSLSLMLPTPSMPFMKIFSIGRYTLEIYILSMCLDKYHLSLPTNNGTIYQMISIPIALCILILCYVLTKLINNSKVLKKVVFGK